MNGNILLVDDTPEVLKLLKDILTAEGYQARPFSDGELALRSAKTEPPDLILLDIRMPGMDGFEVCRRLKEDDRLKDIPVIFLSAASEVEEKVSAFQVGGVDYITKPFHKEEVLARMRAHVALNRSRQEMKRAEEALRKSEERLKMAQAIAHLGHWEWDVNTEEVRWSDETYRILGYRPQEFRPSRDTFLQSVHPDDRAVVARHVDQAREEGRFDMEYRIVLPDGNIRVVRGMAEVIFLGGGGQPSIIETIQEIATYGRPEMIGVIQDITERKQLEWRLEHEARTDALTGCANRRHFLELAGHELARTQRHGGMLSIFMLDLDNFKAINDRYGHPVGDVTLQTLVQVCQTILREEDVIGRLGGEEFAVLLPETGGEDALDVAERLRQQVATAEIPLADQPPLLFTTSVGVTTLTRHDTSIDDLLCRVDQAVYAAKRAGRNKVVVA